jgi:WhiB family redox-sensing transcriptional regulator
MSQPHRIEVELLMRPGPMTTDDFLADIIGRPEWMSRGACIGMATELFFATTNTGIAEAMKVCVLCEVRAECLAHALAHSDMAGVFGGTTTDDRRRLRSIRRTESLLHVAVDAARS